MEPHLRSDLNLGFFSCHLVIGPFRFIFSHPEHHEAGDETAQFVFREGFGFFDQLGNSHGANFRNRPRSAKKEIGGRPLTEASGMANTLDLAGHHKRLAILVLQHPIGLFVIDEALGLRIHLEDRTQRQQVLRHIDIVLREVFLHALECR